MNAARRILVIDSSRYEGFRLRRQLQIKSPDDSLTVMNCARAGLDELARSCYDITIIDLISLLAYQTNGRKFLSEFMGISPDSRLGLIDNVNDEHQQALFSNEIRANFGPDKSFIINRDDLSYLLIPGLVDKLLPSRIDHPALASASTTTPASAQANLPNDLSSKLSHEVNNPLMTILGSIELLLGKPELAEGETGRKLRIIKRSARRIQTSLVKMRDGISQQDNDLPDQNRLADRGILSNN